jgi:SAM-dependent methyltransferase
MRTQNDSIWDGSYKIPWDEPEFSRRMLNEHLSQDHDLASRSLGWIERQVHWIHEQITNQEPSTILDLGCGPGLYSHQLVRLGHHCLGIDFGPASIEYARVHNPHSSRCEFVLGDIRDVAFGGPYDLAMILYGELNVFSPADALKVLRKAQASLASRGQLIVEVQAPSAIERMGRSEPSEQESEAGLFSDRPHRCRTENQWLPEQKVAIQTFSITEVNGGEKRVYRNTTKAWSDNDLVKLLTDAGFSKPSSSNAWPSNSDALSLWAATITSGVQPTR